MDITTVTGPLREIFDAAFSARRIHVRSGFLALWCLEAIVPAVALTAAIAETVGGTGAFATLIDRLLSASIFGETSAKAADWITELIGSTTLGTLGAFGVLSALFVVYQLYAAILFDLNELLECDDVDRSWAAHGLGFVPFCLWLAVFLVAGNLASGILYARGDYLMMPLAWALTTGTVYAGMAGMAREVRHHGALLFGAVVGSAWMELIKLVFVVYSTSSAGADALQVTYRQLAFLPLLFLWMHLVWFSFLLGVLVARRRTIALGAG